MVTEKVVLRKSFFNGRISLSFFARQWVANRFDHVEGLAAIHATEGLIRDTSNNVTHTIVNQR